MFDPDQLLQKLEAASVAETGERLAGTDAAPQCCGFCWTALPEAARVCSGCGQSVDAADAAHQATLEADRRWRPPAREADFETEAAPVQPEPAVSRSTSDGVRIVPPARAAVPRSQRSRRPAQPLMLGVMLGGAWGVAAVALAWFTIVAPYRFGERGAAANVVAIPLEISRSQSSNAAGANRARTPVEWGSRYPELRARLYGEAGELVVDPEDDSLPAETSVPVGIYHLEFVDFTGQWPAYRERLVATADAPLRLSVSEAVAGAYYLWLAEHLEQAGRRPQALRAWEMAVLLAPESVPARLGLAAALQRAERRNEAREWIDAVLTDDPGNAQALTLRSQLDDGRR